MKTVSLIVLMLALVTVSGCYTVQSNSEKGGSVLKGEGFKIAVPTFETDIKQGEVQSITISLERGASFKQDVNLEIVTAKGIGIDPAKVLVKASDQPGVQLRITVPKNAALGAYHISVKGTPKNGEPTSTGFDVRVITP